MIILEGIRRSGKSFTVDVLKKEFPDLIYHKDLGMRIINHEEVGPDSYAVGRDLAYAQFLKKLIWHRSITDRIFFDRGYWSTYVYGQCWRNTYDKQFFTRHIQNVENEYGDFMKQMKVVMITLDEPDLDRIESMDRGKDHWDVSKSDYREQYKLYNELVNMSKAKKFQLKAFQSEDYIVETFRHVLKA